MESKESWQNLRQRIQRLESRIQDGDAIGDRRRQERWKESANSLFQQCIGSWSAWVIIGFFFLVLHMSDKEVAVQKRVTRNEDKLRNLHNAVQNRVASSEDKLRNLQGSLDGWVTDL